MHSRIFQIEKEAVAEDDYIGTHSIPEWFFHSVADYTDDDCDRDSDIEWLMSDALKDIASNCGDKIVFLSDVRKYFKDKYECFTKVAKELSTSSFEDFVTGYNINMKMYRLKEACNDKYGFYVYSEDNLMTLDDFMRTVKGGEVYYIGGTIDYHY